MRRNDGYETSQGFDGSVPPSAIRIETTETSPAETLYNYFRDRSRSLGDTNIVANDENNDEPDSEHIVDEYREGVSRSPACGDFPPKQK